MTAADAGSAAAVEAIEAARRRAIAAYVLCSVVYAVVNNIYGASYVLLMRSRGLGPARIGQALFLSVLVLTVSDYPSGTLADRFGRTRILGLGFILWGAALLGFGLAQVYPAVLGAVVVWAVALALISGTAGSWLVDRLRATGDEVGYRRIFPRTGGLCLLVSAAAAALGSPLVAWAGLAAPVMVAAVLAIGAGLLILFLMPESTGAGTGSLAGSLRESTILVLRGPMRRLLFVNFAASVPLSVFLVTWQLDATERAGLRSEDLGVIFAVLILAMAGGNFLAGVLVPRSSARRVAMAGCGTMLVGSLAAAGGSQPAALVVGLLVIEVGLGLFSGSFVSWVHDLADDDHRAAMTSAVLAVGSAAAAATTPVVGLLLERAGPGAAWGLAAGGAAFAVMFLAAREQPLACSRVDRCPLPPAVRGPGPHS